MKIVHSYPPANELCPRKIVDDNPHYFPVARSTHPMTMTSTMVRRKPRSPFRVYEGSLGSDQLADARRILPRYLRLAKPGLIPRNGSHCDILANSGGAVRAVS